MVIYSITRTLTNNVTHPLMKRLGLCVIAGKSMTFGSVFGLEVNTSVKKFKCLSTFVTPRPPLSIGEIWIVRF